MQDCGSAVMPSSVQFRLTSTLWHWTGGIAVKWTAMRPFVTLALLYPAPPRFAGQTILECGHVLPLFWEMETVRLNLGCWARLTVLLDRRHAERVERVALGVDREDVELAPRGLQRGE